MNKVKQTLSNLSRSTAISLGFIILGIGCISLAMYSVWAPTEYNADMSGYTAEAVEFAANPSAMLPPPNQPLYPVYPVERDFIGSLTIPALNQAMPIYQGTGDGELKKGVGHFYQSVLPGEHDNCVISGHRETFFRNLGDLNIGNQLIVQTSAGTFTYEMVGARIVDADDRTVIVPTDYAVLTLTTCYPFNTPGYYPSRYIVSANLVNSF